MKFSSPIISAGSGSLAGITVSRNKGGLYMRARAIPTNPGTAFQQAVRSAMQTLVARWTETLTPAQRVDWETYAINTPVFDTLGAAITLSGQQMYIRSNVVAVQLSLGAVDDAPTIFNLGSFTPPTIVSVTGATDVLSLAFDNTDEWANEDGSTMIVFGSRPQNPSVNYFKGPYRQLGGVQGDATTPPTSPATLAMPFDYDAGQRAFIKVNVLRADARYSAPARATIVAV